MEQEGKCNAVTSMIPSPTKTLEVKPHTNPGRDPDPETKPGPDQISKHPAKKENQNPRTRGDQTTKYNECQKNHAALTGGHVVDGCCEFMPGGEEGTPGALKCAACSCHRSFHRKQEITPAFYKAMQPCGVYPTVEIGRRTSSSSEDIKKILTHRNQNVDNGKGSKMTMMRKKKKRVRTKINEEQKEKMKEFAEKLGWRMMKKDEEEIDKFCGVVNLRRQVFKVWMHNNKQAIKRNCLH